MKKKHYHTKSEIVIRVKNYVEWSKYYKKKAKLYSTIYKYRKIHLIKRKEEEKSNEIKICVVYCIIWSIFPYWL